MALRARSGVAFSPHALRHTRATELIRAGVPIGVVSKLLTHRSVTTTSDAYVHLDVTRAGADGHHRRRWRAIAEAAGLDGHHLGSQAALQQHHADEGPGAGPVAQLGPGRRPEALVGGAEGPHARAWAKAVEPGRAPSTTSSTTPCACCPWAILQTLC